MKFLLDANIPFSAKELFKKPYIVFHVRDIGLEHSEDDEIINWAKNNKTVLISRDLDFANILHFPPKKFHGILILRIPYFYNIENIKRVLKDFLCNSNLISFSGSTIIIEEGRFRIRK